MPLIIREKNSDAVIAEGSPADQTAQVFEGNWYFDPSVVDMTHLKVTERTYTCPYKGVCFWIDLDTPEAKAQNIAWVYNNPKPGFEMIKDRIGFYSRDTSGTVAVKQTDSEAHPA
ncbi:MAG: DUF427 domain-containing protein [Chloroflexi bacterium]|nr:DUF427 domain-containing protein [Chloroflexota bacterium]